MLTFSNNVEPANGFLVRYLRRKLLESDTDVNANKEELLRVLDWVPKLWYHLHTFLEKHSTSDFLIGTASAVHLPPLPPAAGSPQGLGDNPCQRGSGSCHAALCLPVPHNQRLVGDAHKRCSSLGGICCHAPWELSLGCQLRLPVLLAPFLGHGAATLSQAGLPLPHHAPWGEGWTWQPCALLRSLLSAHRCQADTAPRRQ